MPVLSRLALTAAVSLLFAWSAPAHAEEGFIGKLLRGGKDAAPAAGNVDPAPTGQVKVPESREEISLSFSPVVKTAAKSVVNVYGTRRAREVQSPFAGDPFFERFFGVPQQRRRGGSSLGSGVIVSADGTILTNNHVIANMDEVKIATTDGREFECEIVLKDEKSDLAVLKVKDAEADFEPIAVADSDAVEVGDLVLAIGNPFGVGQTVTMGIVSAVSRSLAGVNDYGYFIQTDASINPGNSGGALVDMKGRLIGINTMIYSRSGGSVGLGYAIPSNMTRVVLDSAKVGNRVTRPWLGASFQNVTAEIAESLGLDRPRGALVAALSRKGPAESAGLKLGDVILEVNGLAIDQPDALGYRLDTLGVGKEAEFTVLSRGREQKLRLALIAPPETTPRDVVDLPDRSVLWGARAANLSPAVAQEIGIKSDEEGVVVLAVAPNSPAALNGIRPGDIVREINGVEVARTSELVEITTKRLRSWEFVVQRAGRTLVFQRDGGFFRQFAR